MEFGHSLRKDSESSGYLKGVEELRCYHTEKKQKPGLGKEEESLRPGKRDKRKRPLQLTGGKETKQRENVKDLIIGVKGKQCGLQGRTRKNATERVLRWREDTTPKKPPPTGEKSNRDVEVGTWWPVLKRKGPSPQKRGRVLAEKRARNRKRAKTLAPKEVTRGGG